MSSPWSVEYQRKDSDTKECLWVSVADPKSMTRDDLKAARVNAQRLGSCSTRSAKSSSSLVTASGDAMNIVGIAAIMFFVFGFLVLAIGAPLDE
jgi:hypothetical protein